MQKIAMSITPQYYKILQYLDINIDIWLGNGIIAQPCVENALFNTAPLLRKVNRIEMS